MTKLASLFRGPVRCAAVTALALLCLSAAASNLLAQRELIVISGGPAMRVFERVKTASHDKYWGNFIRTAGLRMEALNSTKQIGDQITWLVFRPSYVTREKELEVPIIPEIEGIAEKNHANLMWFDNTNQLINYLNRGQDRKTMPIATLDYFGHSNKACFLFDYSNDVDGMSVAYLHVTDLQKIDRGIFAKNAAIQSWGCHSGEMYSQKWKSRFGVPMLGAIGKTDYSGGVMPTLSDSNGKWVQ